MKKSTVLLMALCILLLTACQPVASNPAEARVQQFFQALKNGDIAALNDYVDDEELSFFNGDEMGLDYYEFQQDLLKAMFGKVGVQIRRSSIQDDAATVECTVSAPNMYEAILSVFEDYMMVMMNILDELGYENLMDIGSLSEEEMIELEEKMLSEMTKLFQKTFGNAQTVKTDVTINLYKSGDKWMIEFGDQLADAITGGSYEQLEDFDFGDIF